jgi:hypothetical protein
VIVLPPDPETNKTDDGEEKKDDAAEPKMSLDEFLKMDGEEKKEAPAAEPVPMVIEEVAEDNSGFTPPTAHQTPVDVYTGDELSVRNGQFYAWAAPQTALDKLVTIIDEYKAKDNVDDLIMSGFSTDERHNIITYCKYVGLVCVAKRWYDDVYLFISQIWEPQVLLDKIMALGGKTEKYELIPPRGDEEPEDDGMAEVKAAMAFVPDQNQTNGEANKKADKEPEPEPEPDKE